MPTKDAKIFRVGKRKKNQPGPETPLSGLSAVTVGNDVTVTTEKKDDKDVVAGVKVDMAKKKKKGG